LGLVENPGRPQSVINLSKRKRMTMTERIEISASVGEGGDIRRIFAGQEPGDPLATLIQHIQIETGTNDLSSFRVEGTPVRGTHVLRLLPTGNNPLKSFEKATLSVVYKSYSQQKAS
jgi:hypothetical protein